MCIHNSFITHVQHELIRGSSCTVSLASSLSSSQWRNFYSGLIKNRKTKREKKTKHPGDTCGLWPSRDYYIDFYSRWNMKKRKRKKKEEMRTLGLYPFAQCQFPRRFLKRGTPLFLYLPRRIYPSPTSLWGQFIRVARSRGHRIAIL